MLFTTLATLSLLLSPISAITLGRASGFGVFGNAGTTNAGSTTRVRGNVGVDPAACGSATGYGAANYAAFYCPASTQSSNAATDLAIARAAAAGATPATPISGVLNGVTLTPGIYSITTTASLGGATLTLNGAGTYIFQVGTALTTATGAIVALTGGATACDVWWYIGSSATIFAGTVWKGNILATSGVAVGNQAIINGTVYAGTSVTLIADDITGC
ncbi:hypothetical protein EDC01DRAFT_747540 [Geopyxis carbonaria]|nr:hypothetical protein EDC01DRAFT_747540 [Geopyxis carbonaria]